MVKQPESRGLTAFIKEQIIPTAVTIGDENIKQHRSYTEFRQIPEAVFRNDRWQWLAVLAEVQCGVPKFRIIPWPCYNNPLSNRKAQETTYF